MNEDPPKPCAQVRFLSGAPYRNSPSSWFAGRLFYDVYIRYFTVRDKTDDRSLLIVI